MRFSIVAWLTVAFSAADAAELFSIRLGQVGRDKHILIDPNTGVVFTTGKRMASLKRFCGEASSCRVQSGALGIAVQ